LSTNVVDVLTPDGRYMRALSTTGGTSIVEAQQRNARELEVRIFGGDKEASLTTVKKMLGVDVDLAAWYESVEAFPWLAALAERLRGVKPPRYPDLWETICHGIVFQQLSIVAAAAIMKRFIIEYSAPIEHRGVTLYEFPRPRTVLDAHAAALRRLGLSHAKVTYLKHVAEADLDGRLRTDLIESLPTTEAAAELVKLNGIGPWSAAVILLRGLGRIDTFPLKDSGALASIRIVSGDPTIDIGRVLAGLGNTRGMLYFHLLLGRRFPDGLSG
jgi:DNA-3-methyladenine glycosylase II